MSLSRRSFLKGLAVVVAVPAVLGRAIREIPRRFTLWGDGRHDDAPALQALLDGKADLVDVRDGAATVEASGAFSLRHGTYMIGDTLHLDSASRHMVIEDSMVNSSGDPAFLMTGPSVIHHDAFAEPPRAQGEDEG